MTFCASCGVAEGDNIKLKNCTACHLVRYCGRKCQKNHRPIHERMCEQRAAELRDELLFKQPESSHRGDCPICVLPLGNDKEKSRMMTCCSNIICKGCNYANQKREDEEKLDSKCPMCRTPVPETMDEAKQRLKDRAEMNDPAAMRQFGFHLYENEDYQTAFEYHSKAAELGELEAHHDLGILYYHGHGVPKDEWKAMRHFELAAIGGHTDARFSLAKIESDNGQYERAAKHLIIAVKLGHEKSLKYLKRAYDSGYVSEDDMATTLHAYQTAVDATKSLQRVEAEADDAIEDLDRFSLDQYGFNAGFLGFMTTTLLFYLIFSFLLKLHCSFFANNCLI